MEKTITKYLRHLKIPISNAYLEKLILSHQDYPFLISIADTFEKIGIEYDFLKINKENISQYLPCLIHVERNEGDLIFISNRKDLKKNLDNIHFWNGVILKVKKTDSILDTQNRIQFLKERTLKKAWTFSLSSILIISIITSIPYLSLSDILILFTNLFGITLGATLIQKDLGMSSKILDNFCSTKKNNGCDQILSSFKTKISLSELTLIYFIFQFFCITLPFFFPLEAEKTAIILIILSFLTLPVILFSLIFQFFIIKVRCRLCLLVIGTQFIQWIVFYQKFHDSITLKHLNEMNFIFFVWEVRILLIITLLVIGIVSIFRLVTELRVIERESSSVLLDPYIFKHYLFKQSKLTIKTYETDLKIGQEKAPIKLNLVISLYCQSCWLAFQTISELLLLFPEKVNLTIRFTATGKDKFHSLTTTEYVIAYFIKKIKGNEKNLSDFINLINDWYILGDSKKFKIKYPLEKEMDYTFAIEQGNNDQLWINTNQIFHVPTLIINEYRMPRQYKLTDLKNFIIDLSAQNSLFF